MSFKLVSLFLLQITLFGEFEARSVHGLDFPKSNENKLSKDVRNIPRNSDRTSNHRPSLWEPENMPRDDWLKYHGMSRDKWLSIVNKMKMVDEILNEEPLLDGNRRRPSKRVEEGCMWYTDEQVNEELEQLIVSSDSPREIRMPFQNQVATEGTDPEGSGADSQELMEVGVERVNEEVHRRRQKRKAEDLKKRPHRKWSNPIMYMFDGNHNDRERQIVRDAIKHWEDRTCLKFFEIGSNKPLKQQHLMFTREQYGCYSFVGKTATVPQQINLAPSCLTQFGIPVHEIGHALGLWHEQQRSDRDGWIRVNRENIGFYSSQFWKRNTVSHGVPYDYGSVMHYAGKAGSINDSPTIEALDPLYTSSMGQRVELSYMDAKIINMEYCKDDCDGRPLPRPCERGGYQDPDNCRRCICPDGFGGRYCEKPADANNAKCGGLVELSSNGNTEIIETPGYSDSGHYDDFTECSWVIKAPENFKVSLTFDESDDFGIYCKNSDICFHWVEIKYQSDFEYPGPRFCCYNTPEPRNLTSEGSEMVVVFKSNFPTDYKNTRKGFRATLISVPPEGHKREDDDQDETQNTETETETTQSSVSQTTAMPSGTHWGPWSKCKGHDCKCGGCSHQSRHRMCGEKTCKGELAAKESRPCDKKCSPGDTFLQYTGTFIWARCPVCCSGLDLKGESCVSRK